ncbi:MAG: hypothetical protein ABIY70_04825 [Capsulimonas sp.]|uniref:hypothetical protein n=1 Tax=Capsulimonas sp. TaxID=2494211 RepID=UPI0032669D8B
MSQDTFIHPNAHRPSEERLQRTLTYALEQASAALRMKIDSMSDHKGRLTIKWAATATEAERQFVKSAWEAENEHDIEHRNMDGSLIP